MGEPQWTGSAGGTLTRAEPYAYQVDTSTAAKLDQSDWLLNKASIDPLEDCNWLRRSQAGTVVGGFGERPLGCGSGNVAEK